MAHPLDVLRRWTSCDNSSKLSLWVPLPCDTRTSIADREVTHTPPAQWRSHHTATQRRYFRHHVYTAAIHILRQKISHLISAAISRSNVHHHRRSCIKVREKRKNEKRSCTTLRYISAVLYIYIYANVHGLSIYIYIIYIYILGRAGHSETRDTANRPYLPMSYMARL